MPSMKWKRHRISSGGSSGRHSRSAATNVRLDRSKLSATSCVKSGASSAAAWRAGGRTVLAVAALDLGERGPDEHLDDGLRAAGRRGAVGQQPQALGVQRGAVAPVDLGEQSVLAAEVVADQRPVRAGLGGNRAHRHAAEAAVGKQPLGRRQELFARLGAGRSGGVQWGARRGVVVTAESYSRIEQ